jgi:hypothetical protein
MAKAALKGKYKIVAAAEAAPMPAPEAVPCNESVDVDWLQAGATSIVPYAMTTKTITIGSLTCGSSFFNSSNEKPQQPHLT